MRQVITLSAVFSTLLLSQGVGHSYATTATEAYSPRMLLALHPEAWLDSKKRDDSKSQHIREQVEALLADSGFIPEPAEARDLDEAQACQEDNLKHITEYLTLYFTATGGTWKISDLRRPRRPFSQLIEQCRSKAHQEHQRWLRRRQLVRLCTTLGES